MQKIADHLASKLTNKIPSITEEERTSHAAVSVVLRLREQIPHLLFIQRSISPLDPWSGNIAFPGGRIDPEDRDLKETAERETEEEVGLNLSSASYLGCLPPLPTWNRRVHIAAFAYTIDYDPQLTLDPEEVAATHWIPVNFLTNPSRTLTHSQDDVDYPAIKIIDDDPGAPLLWGLTHRICIHLLGHSDA